MTNVINEEIRVCNTNEKTRSIANEIAGYAHDIVEQNKDGNLELYELMLTLDGASYADAEAILDEEKNFDSAQEITLKASFLSSDLHGIDKWETVLNEELENDVEYRAVEYSYEDDCVFTMAFGCEPVETAEVHVATWDVESINVVVSAEENSLLSDDARESLDAWAENFVKKFDGKNPATCDESELFYGDSLFLDDEKFEEFLAELRNVADIADHYGLELVISGQIMAEEPREFVAKQIRYDGEVIVETVVL